MKVTLITIKPNQPTKQTSYLPSTGDGPMGLDQHISRWQIVDALLMGGCLTLKPCSLNVNDPFVDFEEDVYCVSLHVFPVVVKRLWSGCTILPSYLYFVELVLVLKMHKIFSTGHYKVNNNQSINPYICKKNYFVFKISWPRAMSILVIRLCQSLLDF